MQSWVSISLAMQEREKAKGESFGINADLSSYGNQHLNDNECLRAPLKDLS